MTYVTIVNHRLFIQMTIEVTFLNPKISNKNLNFGEQFDTVKHFIGH